MNIMAAHHTTCRWLATITGTDRTAGLLYVQMSRSLLKKYYRLAAERLTASVCVTSEPCLILIRLNRVQCCGSAENCVQLQVSVVQRCTECQERMLPFFSQPTPLYDYLDERLTWRNNVNLADINR